MKSRIAIIEFPGTNCERETARAVSRAGMEPIPFRWNEDPNLLPSYDGYIIGGGFSYEDRSRSGIIAALDPVIESLKRADAEGKPILGICNGAQILVESGMVPGLEGYRLCLALTGNKQIVAGKVVGTGFYNAWIYLRHTPGRLSCAFTSGIGDASVMRMPAAHAEGRFVIDSMLLRQLESSGAIVLRYCDRQGIVDPTFPVNPNGSVANIAALANMRGNVLAIMPHPERTEAGDPLFHSMRSYIAEHQREIYREEPCPITVSSNSLSAPSVNDRAPYRPDPKAHQLTVASIITDNAAISVEQALRKRGIGVAVRRAVHWELVPKAMISENQLARDLRTAYASGELFNSNKEYPEEPSDTTVGYRYLVRPNDGDDCIGMKTHRILCNRFGIATVQSIRHGVLWTFIPDSLDPSVARQAVEAALATHIICNPFSHRRQRYA